MTVPHFAVREHLFTRLFSRFHDGIWFLDSCASGKAEAEAEAEAQTPATAKAVCGQDRKGWGRRGSINRHVDVYVYLCICVSV